MCMFTLYIVFHRNEEFHDDITTSVQIDTEEIVNEVIQHLGETEGAQQQVWSIYMGVLYSRGFGFLCFIITKTASYVTAWGVEIVKPKSNPKSFLIKQFPRI